MLKSLRVIMILYAALIVKPLKSFPLFIDRDDSLILLAHRLSFWFSSDFYYFAVAFVEIKFRLKK